MSTTTTPVVYPVHLDAELDPALNRGLWLVKWILAIPHYVALAFLWAAFAVTSVVAFFSILFTARYPRALFDFNVGVMRWSWRVAYYAYGALGTDRYPPFTLADVPDYPAHLEVDYPERLSRGLVLVKWWLLAIPHYLVLGLFLGGFGYAVRGADDDPVLGTSLIGLLVLVAGVVLLFTGRYPQPVFDLVLGLNRWVLRVAAYVALMTDRYPPFALDQGGHEPRGENPAQRGTGSPALDLPDAAATGGPHHWKDAAPSPPASGGPRTGWSAGRVLSLVVGSLFVLTSLGLAGAGATLVAADQMARDADGFLTSPQQRISSAGYAITSERIHLNLDGTLDVVPDEIVGDVRLTAEQDAGTPLFLGIAPTPQADAYLAGVRHDTLVEVRDGSPVYRSSTGSRVAQPPSEQDFWVAEARGTAPQLTWRMQEGEWTAVVMNADGSAAVAAAVSAGAEVPVLGGLIAGAFITAGLLLALGVVMIAVPLHAVGRGDSAMVRTGLHGT